MKDKSEDQEITPCRWCGSELILPAVEFADGVCTDCYRLLSNAGITDQEIFADFDPQSGNSSDTAVSGSFAVHAHQK